MLSIEFGMEALIKQVDHLGEVVAKSARPIAKAASEVFYQEARTRAQWAGGKQLHDAIYQKFVEGTDTEHATYHISWRKQKNKVNVKMAKQEQLPWSTIGYWMEFGRIQRYASYLAKDGNWYTAVRADKQGTPKPKGSASQAEKDAYYVLRKGGPAQIAPKPFIRPTYDAKKSEALTAATTRLHQLIGEAFI